MRYDLRRSNRERYEGNSYFQQIQDDIGSRVFPCNGPHQWIAETGRSRVYTVTGCPVSVAWHSSHVWQHIGQSTSPMNRHYRDMTSDVKSTLKSNKQTSSKKITQHQILIIILKSRISDAASGTRKPFR